MVTSYLEMEGHSSCIVNHAKLPGSQIEPRSKCFDEKQHKSLCAELKYLYTAVTRTKCNLWIYDSDRAKRLPVFDYWHKKGLVKVVSTSEHGDGKHDLIFASISTPEQWKVQGDYFRKKCLWEQAQHCYEKSGQENAHLAKLSNAYLLIQRARTQFSPTLFQDAAICLLECDQLHHDIQYITNAAICLRKTRPPRYLDAAKLFEKLGEINHAYFAYKKVKDIDSCVRLKECAGQYNDALKILSDNSKRKALVKAAEYESRGIKVHENYSTRELSYFCAGLYASQKEKALLLEVLQYIPEIAKRVRFMKKAELFEEAYDVHLQQNQYQEAYRLASAQGWYHKGILLAKQQNDSQMEAIFILQKATAEYCRQRHKDGHQRSPIDPELFSLLHLVAKNKDPCTKAKACLLLGIFKQDIGLCRKARETFKFHRHKVGEVEAFHAIADLTTKNESIRSVLDACHAARKAGESLMKAGHLNQVVQHAVKFYNLQEVGDVYCIPSEQDPWIKGLASRCVCKERSKDLNGMLMLSVRDTRVLMAKHCTSFVEKWLNFFEVTQKLVSKSSSFSLHREIEEKQLLSRPYSIAEVPSLALENYLETCIYQLELSLLSNKINTADITALGLIFSVFSPQVSVYLPLSKKHVQTIRKSKKAGEEVHKWMKSEIPKQAERSGGKIKPDPWLTAWRACCITVGNTTALSNIFERKAERINARYKELKTPGNQSEKKSKMEKADSHSSEKAKTILKSASKLSKADKDTTSEFQVPETYILWRAEDRYYHVFSFWLLSCQLIKEQGKILQASRYAICYFLGNIAQNRAVEFSVMNVVDILSVHSTALLVMLTHLNSLQKQDSFSFIVPLLYQHAVQVFDDLNAYQVGHKWVIRACAEEIENATRRRHGLAHLRQNCVKLLWCSLDILLGQCIIRGNYFTIVTTPTVCLDRIVYNCFW